MSRGIYPTITRGLGNLTPEMWGRMMTMLFWFETHNRDERRVQPPQKEVRFLAKIVKAECIQPNVYIYAWEEVRLTDDWKNDSPPTEVVVGGRTSTEDGNEFAFPAINVIELANTSALASGGVDMGADQYPDGYGLQAIGGGGCTGSGCEVEVNVEAVVVLHKIGGESTEKAGEHIHFFTAVNDHDGECGAEMVSIDDSIDEDPSPITNKANIYVSTDGDLKVIFEDGTVKTIVTDD